MQDKILNLHPNSYGSQENFKNLISNVLEIMSTLAVLKLKYSLSKMLGELIASLFFVCRKTLFSVMLSTHNVTLNVTHCECLLCLNMNIPCSLKLSIDEYSSLFFLKKKLFVS